VTKLKNKNLIIVGVIALIIGGAAGFLAGSQYQKGKAQTRFAQFAGPAGAAGARRFANVNGANAMVVRGQIIKADNNSVTVKLTDGSTKIVILGSSTMIGKTTTGSTTDLTDGSTVTVFGNTNSDGSVTAQNIQIGNGVMFGGPRGSGTPSASPSSTNQGY